MAIAYSLVLDVETTSAAPHPPLMDFLIFRLLINRPAEIDIKPDGSRTYRYRMAASEISAAREQAERLVISPTAEGLMDCLSSLAREALDLGLNQASWAIDLATQMIRLQQDGADAESSPSSN